MAAFQHCCSKKKPFQNLSQLQNIIIVSKIKWDNSKTRFGCLRTLWLRKTLKRLQKFVWAAIQQNGFENILKHFRNCCSRNSTLLLPKQPKPHLKNFVAATQQNCSGKIWNILTILLQVHFKKIASGSSWDITKSSVSAAIPHYCLKNSQGNWRKFSQPQFHFLPSITFLHLFKTCLIRNSTVLLRDFLKTFAKKFLGCISTLLHRKKIFPELFATAK